MVEKSHSRHSHRHAVLIADLDDVIVSDRSAGLRDNGNAALLRSFDIITEWEERVGAQRNACNSVKVCSLLCLCEGLGLSGKECLPNAVSEDVIALVGDINVDSVISVGTLYAVDKGKVQHLLVLTEMPDVSLVPARRVQWILDC